MGQWASWIHSVGTVLESKHRWKKSSEAMMSECDICWWSFCLFSIFPRRREQIVSLWLDLNQNTPLPVGLLYMRHNSTYTKKKAHMIVFALTSPARTSAGVGPTTPPPPLPPPLPRQGRSRSKMKSRARKPLLLYYRESSSPFLPIKVILFIYISYDIRENPFQIRRLSNRNWAAILDTIAIIVTFSASISPPPPLAVGPSSS